MKINKVFLFFLLLFCATLHVMGAGQREMKPLPDIASGIDWLPVVFSQELADGDSVTILPKTSEREHSAHEPNSLMRQSLAAGLGACKVCTREFKEIPVFSQEERDALKSIPAIAPYILYNEYMKKKKNVPLAALEAVIKDGGCSEILARIFFAHPDLANFRTSIDSPISWQNDRKNPKFKEIAKKRGRPVNDTERLWFGEFSRGTLLHIAVENDNNAGLVELLIQAGADPYALDEDGYTPLDVALRLDHPAVLRAMLEVGCRRGIDFSRQDKLGMTLLHIAALRGHVRAVDMLLRAGVNESITDVKGRTYKDWCGLSGWFKRSIFQAIMDKDFPPPKW